MLRVAKTPSETVSSSRLCFEIAHDATPWGEAARIGVIAWERRPGGGPEGHVLLACASDAGYH